MANFWDSWSDAPAAPASPFGGTSAEGQDDIPTTTVTAKKGDGQFWDAWPDAPTPSTTSRATPNTPSTEAETNALQMAGPAATPGASPSPAAGVLAGFANTATQGTPPASKEFGQQALRSATLGGSELAIPEAEALLPGNRLPGEGIQDAAARMRAARRATLEQWQQRNPGQSMVATGAGALASAPVTGSLFGVAGEGAGLGARALNYGRNVGVGAGLGAAQGMMENPDQPVQGAIEGGAAGGLVGGVAPAIGAAVGGVAKGVGKVAGPLFSQSSRESAVGQKLGEAVGNNPALQNKDTLVPGGMEGIGEALTGPAGIAPGATHPGEASATLREGLQGARGAAQAEETRLWTVPELDQVQVSSNPIKSAIADKAQELQASGPVSMQGMPSNIRKFPAFVSKLPDSTTVRDLNMIRSDLLSTARATDDPNVARVARSYADAFLGGMDQMPELQANPQIRQAYQAARDFTRESRTAFAQPGIEGALGFKTDPATAGERIFNFSAGGARGGDELAGVRRIMVNAGKDDLAAGLQDQAKNYIISTFMKQGGMAFDGQKPNASQLLQSVVKHRDWIQRTGAFNGKQMEVLNQVGQTLEAMNALKGAASAIQKSSQSIISPILNKIAQMGGVAMGAHTGGVGTALEGLVGGNLAGHMLTGPRAAVQEIIQGALADPKEAADLMANIKTPPGRLMPETRALLQRLTAMLGTEGAVSAAPAMSGMISKPKSQPSQ